MAGRGGAPKIVRAARTLWKVLRLPAVAIASLASFFLLFWMFTWMSGSNHIGSWLAFALGFFVLPAFLLGFRPWRARPYTDPGVGTLRRTGGRWQGVITLLPEGPVPLLLSGGLKPDEQALALARALGGKYATLRDDIQNHLFRHYQPCAEAGSCPVHINAPDHVWQHVALQRVLIEPLNGAMTLEIAYRIAWDEEHIVGAWIRDWRVFELCGSVGP